MKIYFKMLSNDIDFVVTTYFQNEQTYTLKRRE
jgi:hypothetical protein